jgi:hypothetical protein|tara:strand:+ start:54 stop:611 length:558 start_codon:yes stop_codon:yes gene_type:complete
MKKLLLLLLFIPLVSFGQTKEIDQLRKIWIDDLFEFDDIVIKDIDWNETFVPYLKNRENRSKVFIDLIEDGTIVLLNRIGLQTGTYTTQTQAKDANNREMTLSHSRIGRGRYWIDINNSTPMTYKIIDSKNNFEIVGVVRLTKTNNFKKYDKAYSKYVKKNKIDKRRRKGPATYVWEEILKRYNN